jgi:hypothetical protein
VIPALEAQIIETARTIVQRSPNSRSSFVRTLRRLFDELDQRDWRLAALREQTACAVCGRQLADVPDRIERTILYDGSALRLGVPAGSWVCGPCFRGERAAERREARDA